MASAAPKYRSELSGGPVRIGGGGYKPEPTKYTEKSNGVILGRVIEAKKMAATVRKLANDVKFGGYAENTMTIDHMVDLFQSKHQLNLPADKRYVQFDAYSSKAADIIFRVLGMTMAMPQPQFVGPAGAGRADWEKASARIEGHLSHVYGWMTKKYETRWDIQNRFWQLLAGRSYLQQSYLPAYWNREILRRKPGEGLAKGDTADEIAQKNTMYNTRVAGYKGWAGPPFFVENIDPRTCFAIQTPMGPIAHVKVYNVERYELNDSFERIGKQVSWSGRKGKEKATVRDIGSSSDETAHATELAKPAGQNLPLQSTQASSTTGKVEYYEYIDDVMVYYVIGDEVVYRYKHDGGIKIFASYGLQTGFKEYNLAAVGILWAVRNEIPQFDFLRTLWVQKAYLDVFPQLIAQLESDESPLMEGDSPMQWVIEPMTIKQMRGKLINALKDAGSSVDFRAVVEMYAGDIDLATIPGLARGVGGAQQPGYAINQLRQAMSTMWKPILESAEEQISRMYEHYLWCVKNIIKSRVCVYGESVDDQTGKMVGDYFDVNPDDIPDFFMVKATLDPDLPIDVQGTMQTYSALLEKGQVTEEDWVRDGLRKNNPIAYMRQARRDAMRRAWSPDAMSDAMALGRVKLTTDILKARGLDKGNSLANIDIQALKAGQQSKAPPAGQEPPAAGAVAPPQIPPAPVPPGGNVAPVAVPATALGGQGQRSEAVGANPNNPTGSGPHQ